MLTRPVSLYSSLAYGEARAQDATPTETVASPNGTATTPTNVTEGEVVSPSMVESGKTTPTTGKLVLQMNNTLISDNNSNYNLFLVKSFKSKNTNPSGLQQVFPKKHCEGSKELLLPF